MTEAFSKKEPLEQQPIGSYLANKLRLVAYKATIANKLIPGMITYILGELILFWQMDSKLLETLRS